MNWIIVLVTTLIACHPFIKKLSTCTFYLKFHTFGANLKIMKILSTLVFSIIVLFFLSCGDSSTPSNTTSNTVIKQAIKPYNIDSLCSAIKKDSLYDIRDVYYNKADSSLNIAFTNKDNAVKDGTYSTKYFEDTYRIDTIAMVDGISLFEYKKNKSLAGGNYKKPLEVSSKKAYALTEAFKNKYIIGGYCEPLKSYLQEHMNDPDSFEEDKVWVEWLGADNFLVTMTYRGKNAFGGLVLNKCSAHINIQGDLSDFKDLTGL